MTDLLRVSFEASELVSQFSSDSLLSWGHGSVVLGYSSSPQGLSVRVELKGEESTEGHESLRHAQLVLLLMGQQSHKLLMHSSECDDLSTRSKALNENIHEGFSHNSPHI